MSRFLGTLRSSLCLGAACMLAACGSGGEPDAATRDQGGGGAVGGEAETLADALPPMDGAWSPSNQGDRPALLFQAADGERLVRLACDDAGGLVIDRFRKQPSEGLRLMVVQAGEAVGRLATRPVETGQPILRAVIPPGHELMAELVSSPRLLLEPGSDGGLSLPLDGTTTALVRACQPDTPAAAQTRPSPGSDPAVSDRSRQQPAAS